MSAKTIVHTVQNSGLKTANVLSWLDMSAVKKFSLAPERKPPNISIVHRRKSSMAVFMLRAKRKVGLSNKYELAGTSNVVSIDTVLGDEPIVVTPSPFRAWHGIAMGFRL